MGWVIAGRTLRTVIGMPTVIGNIHSPLMKAKLKFLRCYCSELWDMSHNEVETVYIAWRKGPRLIFDLTLLHSFTFCGTSLIFF